MNRIDYEICHNEKGQWWWRQLYNSNCEIACSSQIYSPNNVKNSRQGAIRGAVGHHKAMYYWKNWTNKQAKQDMLFRGILKIFDEVRAAEGETKMGTNSVRQALLERRLTLGTWIQIGHPAVAEILAEADFDWIAADMEHTDIDNAAFADLARAMHGRGVAPLARVRENDTLAIRQVLDLGAHGVIVPLVHTAEDAERAVAAAKYPPRGVRGYCFSRMNDWGKDFDAYAAQANDDIAVVVMIESKQGVENIDAILSVDGVDGVFIGPYDLSGSCGVPGQTGHEQVLAGCRRVLDACKTAGKSAGLHVVIPERDAVAKAVEDGFTFLALGVDTVFLRRSAADALAATGNTVKEM